MEIRIHSEFESPRLVYNHATKFEQSGADYFYHYHDVTELIFVRSGEMGYSTGERSYTLTKNTLVLTRAGDSHCLHLLGDQPYERYDILFDEKDLDFPLFSRLPAGLDLLSFEGDKNVRSILERMDLYCSSFGGEDLDRLLWGLVSELLMNAILAASGGEELRERVLSPTLAAALGYIDEHLLSLADVDELCRALYISKSHLHHLFTEQLGVGPKKYIAAKRLEKARRALSAGEKATDIYAEFGYGDYSSFFRAYKKHFGYSPAETPKHDCVRISFSDYLKGSRL